MINAKKIHIYIYNDFYQYNNNIFTAILVQYICNSAMTSIDAWIFKQKEPILLPVFSDNGHLRGRE